MNNKKQVLLVVAALFVVIVATWVFRFRRVVFSTDFERLVVLIRSGEDSKGIESLAKKLREDPNAIPAIIADCNTGGGRTLGVSSFMLATSTLSNNVESGLKALCSNPREPRGRRIEATRILWERTGDLKYLVQLFDLVKPNGGTEVHSGRIYLRNCIQDDKIRSMLNVEADQNISQRTEEFEKMIKQSGVFISKPFPTGIPITR